MGNHLPNRKSTAINSTLHCFAKIPHHADPGFAPNRPSPFVHIHLAPPRVDWLPARPPRKPGRSAQKTRLAPHLANKYPVHLHRIQKVQSPPPIPPFRTSFANKVQPKSFRDLLQDSRPTVEFFLFLGLVLVRPSVCLPTDVFQPRREHHSTETADHLTEAPRACLTSPAPHQ